MIQCCYWTIGNILQHLKLLHFEYCWNTEQFDIQNQFGVYSGSCPETCNKVIMAAECGNFIRDKSVADSELQTMSLYA